MVNIFKRLFKKHFDYIITGEYYDNDGKGHYTKKYNKKYFLKRKGA